LSGRGEVIGFYAIQTGAPRWFPCMPVETLGPGLLGKILRDVEMTRENLEGLL